MRRWIWSLALLLLALPALADDATPVTFLTPEQLAAHQKTIQRVENYLSGLTTIVADFTQVAPDATLSTGKFYLQRPGRMRWQYHPPTPVLIVADGSEMVFFDYELEQVSRVPLDSTLIGFLAQERIRFDNTVGVRSVEEESGVVRITVAQRDKPDEGELMMEFSDRPLLIRNMVVTDAAGQVTSVSLNNARFGQKLDKELFIFRDPRQRKIR